DLGQVCQLRGRLRQRAADQSQGQALPGHLGAPCPVTVRPFELVEGEVPQAVRQQEGLGGGPYLLQLGPGRGVVLEEDVERDGVVEPRPAARHAAGSPSPVRSRIPYRYLAS